METVLNLDDTPPSQLDMARALLTPKPRRESALPTLAAAALFAAGGLLLAYAVITAPMAEYESKDGFEPVVEAKPDR
jgi:hypothetical protein